MNLQQGKWIYVTGMSFQEFCEANKKALQRMADKFATPGMPGDELLRDFLLLETHRTSWEKLNHRDDRVLTEWLSNRLRGMALGKTFDSYVAEHYLQIFRDANAASRKHCSGRVPAEDIVSKFYVRMKSGILTRKDTWDKAPKSPIHLRVWIWIRLCFICREMCKTLRGRNDDSPLPEDIDLPDREDLLHSAEFSEGVDQLSKVQLRILYHHYLKVPQESLRVIAEILSLPYDKVRNEHNKAILILRKHMPGHE